MSDQVNHPKHYNSHPSGIECIDIVRHMSFNIGNAMKYLWRADEKGAPIEDLEKAIWYLQDEVTKRRNELIPARERTGKAVFPRGDLGLG